MFHVVSHRQTPSQAAAALTSVVQLMSLKGAPPTVGAETGEESVETTPKKRKAETPAQIRVRKVSS